MFEDVGTKIKSLAKTFCCWGIILSIILAIVTFYLADEYYRVEEIYYTLGVVLLVLGPLASWINSLILYGFGELIEKVCYIDRHIQGGDKMSNVQVQANNERINKLEKLRSQGIITEEEYLQIMKNENL